MASQQISESVLLLGVLELILKRELRELSPLMLLGLDETLRKLRSSVSCRLNEMRPINRLPSEILLRIFEDVRTQKVTPSPQMQPYYVDFPLMADIGPPPPPDTRSLISVTHVCRQWRDVALTFPPLWADTVATSALAARTFVSRAGSLPMRVHVAVTGSKLSKLQKKALRCLLPHTRELVLRLRYRIEIQLFKPILQKLVTSLVYLGIVVHPPHPILDRESLVFRDGYHLFGREACALTSLAIVSPTEFIPKDHCPHLRELTIHQPVLWRPDTSPLALAQFLTHTPNLERFLLLFPKMLACLPLVDGHIQLPRLRIIRVQLPSDDSEAIHSLCGAEALSGSLGDVSRCGYTILGRSRKAPGCTMELASLRMSASSIFSGHSNTICQFSTSPWFARGPKSLRITRGCFSPILSPSPQWPLPRDMIRQRRKAGQSFLALFGPMPALERLVVRATTCDVVLPDLCSKLVVNPPHGCPSLHTVIFSVLLPRCALEDLQILFRATTLRAALNLGTPLKRLIICSPTHTGPDYSMYDCHGVEWITFSSSDAGSSSPDSMWTEWNAELVRDAQLDPNGDGPIWGQLDYDQAWNAYTLGSIDGGRTRLKKVGVSVCS